MESLLNLLPNGGNSCVDQLSNEIKYLQRVLFLIQEAEEALDYFLKGTLSHFDPHVGDTVKSLICCKFDFAFSSLRRPLSFKLSERHYVSA